MNKQPVQLDELDIIGYAEALDDGKGPAVVPPVFRDPQHPDQCFVPPFRIAENWLIDPQCLSLAEVKDLAADERITLLPGPSLPAQPGHRLWVDLEGQVHYEPAPEATRSLRKICNEHLNAATAALRQGEIDRADEEAGIALAADDTKLEPNALVAACHALRAEEKELLFMRESVEAEGFRLETFALLLESYMEMVPAEKWRMLRPQAIAAACEKAGVVARLRFQLPATVMPFLAPVVRDAVIRRNGGPAEVRCGGSDALFVAKFQAILERERRCLRETSPGEAVEVVRNAYRAEKLSSAPATASLAPDLDDYFSRLGEVLVTTRVLWPGSASGEPAA
jgi:hypothetical protein